MERINNFSDFYQFYLGEHRHPVCRRLHVFGTAGAGILLLLAVLWAQPLLALAGLAMGYTCAWVGHFAFERNRPATFRYPLYSFVADWVMLRDVITRRVPW